MKKLFSLLAVITVMVASFGMSSQAQALDLSATTLLQSSTVLAATERVNQADAKILEFGEKLDLNNSDVRDFRELRGFYPTLAGKIIDNSPYEKVEDVLNIPGLSETQKARLQANLDKFTVTEPADIFNEGDDRFNPGVY